MKNKNVLIYTGIVSICFLYTGSAFMSQSFRLMEFYSEQTVDIITSVFNYILQAAGILFFSVGLNKYPSKVSSRKLFIYLLITGSFFMCLSQLSNSGLAIQITGYIFNFHIGIYFGYYLAMISQNISPKMSGLCFGSAYAIASVGTYIMSRLKGGEFLVSKEVTAIYLIMASLTIALVYMANDLTLALKEEDKCAGKETDSDPEHLNPSNYISLVDTIKNKDLHLPELLGIVALITIIFSVGSGLYYSLPVADSVNWNMIRAFYAIGLVLAGFIMDRNRFVGEVLAVASLTYPLIMLTLVGDGVTTTVALGMSYVVRGFMTIYYITAFTDLGWNKAENISLAPLGLMTSRLAEAIITIPLMIYSHAEIAQLILASACFVPLLILFVMLQSRKHAPEPMSETKRFALYSEMFNLTSREMEILQLLKDGRSDLEIADKLYISKNTVRFHISNLLKKTKVTSRIEAVQSLDKFNPEK